MREHIETRKKLKEICDQSEFNSLLDKTMLTDEERTVLQMYYIKGKNLCYIADILGYSEVTIKRRHREAIKKIGKMI